MAQLKKGISVLVLAFVVCTSHFFLNSRSAYAATISRADAHPLSVSGGGCTSDGTIEACVNFNRSGDLIYTWRVFSVPSGCVSVKFELIVNGGLQSTLEPCTATSYGYSAGPQGSGQTFQTGIVMAFSNEGALGVLSPVQHT